MIDSLLTAVHAFASRVLISVSAAVNWRFDFFVFYYIDILKCMKDFIFCKITEVYYLCFKCKKTNSVIPSNSRTLLKDANTFGLY